MRRREIIAGLGAVALHNAWPVGALGQMRRIPKVGFLYPGLTAAGASRVQAFREGLGGAGWGEGQVQIEARFAGGVSARNATLAQELVAANVDVLVPISFVSVDAVRAATKTIPIVAFDLESDPVASGMAATLGRPGGNVTGVFFDFPDFRAKWMQLLKEAIPRLAHVVVLRDSAVHAPQLKGIETAAGLLGVKVEVTDVTRLSEFDDVFRAIGERHPDALVILSSPLFGTNPGRVAELTTRYRLPTITLFPEFARAGGLMAYGVDLLGAFRQTGGMVGKVLGGAKVAELPIERPSKFELVVNAKTAKAFSMDLPTSILLRADEVIE